MFDIQRLFSNPATIGSPAKALSLFMGVSLFAGGSFFVSANLTTESTALSEDATVIVSPISQTQTTEQTAPAKVEPAKLQSIRTAQTELQAGLAAQNIGDYQQAAREYEAVRKINPAAAEAVQATYQLGVVAYVQSDYARAIQLFNELRTNHPQDPTTDIATFWLAQSYRDIGQTQQALELYDRFATAHAPVADYVRLQRVQLFSNAGDTASLLRELAAINASPTSTQVKQQAQRMYADALMTVGDFSQAADVYQGLVRMQGGTLDLLSQASDALGKAGRVSEQQQTVVQVIRTYPSSANALQYLTSLANPAAVGLTPYQIGRVYYFHRQDQEALVHFSRQKATLPGSNETAWARYRTAIVYERLNRNAEALVELASIEQLYPNSDAAADALWERGLLLQQMGRFAEASPIFQEYQAKYPSKDPTQNAFNQGLLLYQEGKYHQAAQALNSTDGARNKIWLGKSLEAMGDKAGAQRAYADAARQEPGTYYGLRAQELVNGASASTRGIADAGISADDKAAAVAWLTKTVPAATADAIADARQRIAVDPGMQRGLLLDKMGQWDSATTEYRAAVKSYASDVPALYALAEELNGRGQASPSIVAVAYIKERTATKNDSDLPRLLQKVLYPTPYLAQVESAAKQYGVDPLLMFSLMRQESLCNPRAVSSATAAGLTQVMPATGTGIAQDLKITNFQVNDLYRPMVAIQFGSYYLAKQITYLGDPIFAIAAYNGGAGSALRWMSHNRQIDRDLFVENVDYTETQTYVRKVMENYNYYKLLYQAR